MHGHILEVNRLFLIVRTQMIDIIKHHADLKLST